MSNKKKKGVSALKAQRKAQEKRILMLIRILIVILVITIIVGIALLVAYLRASKKSNTEKLSDEVADFAREDEYIQNGDQTIFEELTQAVREHYVYALESDNVFDAMYPYWDNFLVADSGFSYPPEKFKAYYEAIQQMYHTKSTDPQHVDIIFTPVVYEGYGPYYLFYCNIEYSFITPAGVGKTTGKMEYCFTMRKMGTIDNHGNDLGEQWRLLDFNVQDIGAIGTRFVAEPMKSDEAGKQLAPGLYEIKTTEASKEGEKK